MIALEVGCTIVGFGDHRTDEQCDEGLRVDGEAMRLARGVGQGIAWLGQFG